MRTNCKLSCGMCRGGAALEDCQDRNSQCPWWSATGECEANPRYMHPECRDSCKLCPDDFPGRDDVYASLERRFVRNQTLRDHPAAEMTEHLYDPQVYVFDGFLSHEECDELKEFALPSLAPAVVINRTTGANFKDKVRTNMQMYVSNQDSREHPLISTIVQRMYDLARIPMGHGEALQIGRYQEGQFYEPHFDSEPAAQVVRKATVLVYLEAPQSGGHTIFPKRHACLGHEGFLACCNESIGVADGGGISIAPAKGKAILFYSHDLDGRHNRWAVHGSCPVETGEKWVSQQWFRMEAFPGSPHWEESAFQQKKRIKGFKTANKDRAEHIAV